MKKELDEKLVEKYPKIFKDRYGDMKETAMCWGIDCDDGWYWLIDQLCQSIQFSIDNDHPAPEQVVAEQVKEKLGGLRFYVPKSSDQISGMIRIAQSMSYSICENCGSTENVTQTKGWIKTLCDKCMVEYENRFKE